MNQTRGSECRVSTRETYAVDNRCDLAVARLAARQLGVLSLDELRACGLDRVAVGVRVRRGGLHPLYRAVYAVGHRNVTLEGRFLAAVKACGAGAVLSHFAAAALWDLVRWDGRPIDITVLGTTTRTHPRLRVHRTTTLAHHATCHRLVPVTTPLRTILDLAAILDVKPLRRAIREAQARKQVDLRDLMRAPPRRGSRKLTRILATSAALTRSDLEDIVLDLILDGGLAHPDVNIPLVINGRRIVPDFRWPTRRLVLEADGAAWHDHRLAREDDAERQAILEAAGERVVRVSRQQAIARPAQTLARLRAAGAPSVVVEDLDA